VKKGTDPALRRWRTIAVLAVGLTIGVAMAAMPASGHVGGTVNHLWSHLKPKADARYANAVAGTDKAKDADKLDGIDSTGFAPSAAGTDKAKDADKLDGIDSSGFAPSAAEALRTVGEAGQPGFNSNAFCSWGNLAGDHAQASFYKDPWGTVHVQGLVKATDGLPAGCEPDIFFEDRLIFTLPEGYRPARRSVYMVLTNEQIARLNIDPGGEVSVGNATPNINANVNAWVSIQGLTFRAEAPVPGVAGALKLKSPEPARSR
jgi:hypothetical protein